MASARSRAPLASIPHATNSPHRPLTNSGSKRPRNQANVSQQENEHPHKRLAIDRGDTGPTTPSRNTVEGRVFDRGHGTSGSNAFQRRLAAARDRTGTRVTRAAEPTAKEAKEDSIRQWQKHYRKLFPSFSFYFDSVGDDTRARFVRHITALGAKEEKFFSKSVTHIITTRPVPAEDVSSAASTSSGQDDQPQTINPSLLDKSLRQRREHATVDILQRGRQMGMKIWAAEKLQRVLTSMLDDHSTKASTTRPREDLSRALRNDKIATAERDQPSQLRDIVHFKGPYIYVRDMDERYRPTMVREYKPALRRGEGEWPQFRSAAIGKCPFIEDLGRPRERDAEQDRARQAARQRKTEAMQPPRRVSPRKALQEVAANPAPATINPAQLHKRTNSSLSFPPHPPQTHELRAPGSLLSQAREPAASGIQPSRVTSAIQSNQISSTAATGVKAAPSEKVNQLQRKVFEKANTASLSNGSMPSSHRMNDLAGALKNARMPAPSRAAKNKANEKLGGDKLGGIEEEGAEEVSAPKPKQGRKKSVREPKPGYCENCRDKYDDFDDHILSRKHRKFATTQSNWEELDALLAKLQ